MHRAGSRLKTDDDFYALLGVPCDASPAHIKKQAGASPHFCSQIANISFCVHPIPVLLVVVSDGPTAAPCSPSSIPDKPQLEINIGSLSM